MTSGWVQLIGRWLVSTGLARHVAAAECTLRELETNQPLPEEMDNLSPSVAGRRLEAFAMGRVAASRAMADLGVTSSPVHQGPGGEPLWPSKLKGSIAHTHDLGIALVANAGEIDVVGIDVEHARRAPEIAELVAFDHEIEWIQTTDGGIDHVRLVELFAIKEAIFKGFFPRVQFRFEFDAVRVRPNPDGASTHLFRFVEPIDADYAPARDLPANADWSDDRVFAWVVLPA